MTVGVGPGQAARDLDPDVERLGKRHRPLVEPLRERTPLEELEDQERSRLRTPDVVQGDQVGMGEARRRLGLAQQPLLAKCGRPCAGPHDLEGDPPSEESRSWAS